MQRGAKPRVWDRAVSMAFGVMLLVAACGQGDGGNVTQTTASTEPTVLAGAELRSVMLAEARTMGGAGAAKQFAISSRPGPDTTVEEFYTRAAEMAAAYAEALDEADAAAGRLEALLGQAIETGRTSDLIVDAEVVREMLAEFRLWLEAERLQNDPNLCRETFPQGSEAFLFESAAGPDFVECLTDFLSNPKIERGSFEAAVRLRELGEEIGNAWAN